MNYSVKTLILSKIHENREMEYFALKPEMFNLSMLEFEKILVSMQNDGYIMGLIDAGAIEDGVRRIAQPYCPKLTQRGLRYLRDQEK